MNSFRKVVMCAALLIAMSGCLTSGVRQAGPTPAPDYANYSDRLPCVDRIGRCFDATIDGKVARVVPTKVEFEALNKKLKALNKNIREVYWVIDAPVPGKIALDVDVEPNAVGKIKLGESKEEPDITVYALDGQDLESTTELKANESVRVNGQAIVTKQDTLTDNHLPPGRYVLSVKYIGVENWDRKWILITVK